MLKRLLAACLATTALFGCRPAEENVGGKDREVFVRSAVSLSPSATEIVPGKAFTIQLLGRTNSCNYPATVSSVEIVMNGVKPNYERIAQLKPDIVIYEKSLFSDQEIRKFEDLKLRTFAIEGDTLDEFEKCLYRLGSVLGAETALGEYVDDIINAQANAAASRPETPVKVAMIMPGERGDHYICGTKSFIADIIRNAGGEPVGPQSNQFEMLSAESMIEWNPEIVFCAGKHSPFLKDPRFANVAAIKKGYLVPLDPDRALRKGARVPDLIKGVSKYIAEPFNISEKTNRP